MNQEILNQVGAGQMKGIDSDKRRLLGKTEIRSPWGWTPINRVVFERYMWGNNCSVDGGIRVRVVGAGISVLAMNALLR